MTTVRSVVLVAALVLLAGCTGATVPDASTPTDAPRESPVAATPGPAPAGMGSVAFYVSDERNAIGDFAHLNVTITKLGFERASAGWVEHDVNATSIDLTRLQGANATFIDDYDVPNGTYTKVFIYVNDVNATLTSGEQVRVKLPSQKLHVNKNFTVDDGAQVDFVFDISVHKAGNSGKYILKPVVTESGTDVPINDVDADEDPETELSVGVVGNASPGENVTLRVTRAGEPVENATVIVNGGVVGTTDAAGELMTRLPNTDEVEIRVQKGEAEGELELEFDEGDEADDDEAGPALSARFIGAVSPGENATLRVTRGGTPVANATVTVNDVEVGTTASDGELTFAIPDEDDVTVSVASEDESVELEREFESA